MSKVDFNKYYQQFFITTFRDVRVYTKEGNLFKMYKKLAANEHFESDVKIKSFIFEDNFRKFYVGFSNGAIMQFNAGNGSLIKPINEIEIEKDGIQSYIYSHSKEVTAMYYYNDDDNDNENLILLSTSYDSLINVYDESNPEETEKLRSIKGGHTLRGKSLEINCLDFSNQLNLFATGSTDSLVVIWNFELSKIEDILFLQSNKIDKLNVNHVKFIEPYPLIAVAYSEGSVYIWGIKEQNIRGNCLLRMRNYAKNFKKIEPFPVKFMNTIKCELKEVNTSLCLLKYFDEESPFMNPNKPYSPPKVKIKENNEEGKEKNPDEKNVVDEETNLDIIESKYKKEIIDPKLSPEIYDLSTDNNNELIQRYFLILGDALGNVKMLDLMGLIKKHKINLPQKAYIKSSFNILKKDDINAETILNHNIMPVDEKSLPKFTNLYINVIKKEFKAHNDEINCITILTEPLCYITCSKDKFVKIWNIDCQCLGVISPFIKINKNDKKFPEWSFKINDEKILEDEINEVVGIFEKVGARKILKGSKEDKEIDHIVVEDRNAYNNNIRAERNEERRKTDKNYEEKKEEKKNNDYFDEKNAYGEGYDSYYAQDKQNQIEGLINGDNIPKVGINQMTVDAIKNMVENKESNKNKKKDKHSAKRKEKEKK
jgi:WD40 repeat protein